MVLVGVAGVIVLAQSTRCCNVFKSDNPSSLWMRKWFHLLALGVYVPGIAFDPPLLKMASVLVTIAFIIIEVSKMEGVEYTWADLGVARGGQSILIS
jgi:dolichol kinase